MQNLMGATSLLPKILTSTQVASTSAVTVYTCPAATAAMVKHGSLCNTGAVAVTVSLSLVPSGGSADGTHRALSGYSLAAGDTLSLTDYVGGACLGPADFISVTCSAANVVDVVLTGTESS